MKRASSIAIMLLAVALSAGADEYDAFITRIGASSCLPDKAGASGEESIYVRYAADKAFDADPATVWAEGASDAGVGETIVCRLDRAIQFDEIEIMGGYFTDKYYKANNRVKVFSLEFASPRSFHQYMCRDAMTSQRFKLKQAVSTDGFTLTVKQIYPGAKWNDTCLAELAFLYRGRKLKLACNRIRYAEGKYDFSLVGESVSLFPQTPEGFPIALYTLKRGGELTGDLGPGSQVGMPIMEGGWRFQDDCTIELEYEYSAGMKMMGEEEEASPASVFGGRAKLLIRGAVFEEEGRFSSGGDFACAVLESSFEAK